MAAFLLTKHLKFTMLLTNYFIVFNTQPRLCRSQAELSLCCSRDIKPLFACHNSSVYSFRVKVKAGDKFLIYILTRYFKVCGATRAPQFEKGFATHLKVGKASVANFSRCFILFLLGAALKGKNLLPCGSKFISLRVIPT